MARDRRAERSVEQSRHPDAAHRRPAISRATVSSEAPRLRQKAPLVTIDELAAELKLETVDFIKQ